MEVRAEPAHPFRYNQPRDAANQTKRLLTRPRAFFPGERVSLAFALPEAATLAAPARVRVALALHDLLGARLASLGETTLAAADRGVDGRLDWTVPPVAEGQYLLAAQLSAEDGKPLASRSDVVFVTPAYPRLLAAAEEALARARERAATLEPLLRDVSLPSTEMLVEDAQMSWSDFGHAPRDWSYVRRQLETAAPMRRSSRPARTRGGGAAGRSRRPTVPRSTAPCSPTRCTCRRRTTPRSRGLCW